MFCTLLIWFDNTRDGVFFPTISYKYSSTVLQTWLGWTDSELQHYLLIDSSYYLSLCQFSIILYTLFFVLCSQNTKHRFYGKLWTWRRKNFPRCTSISTWRWVWRKYEGKLYTCFFIISVKSCNICILYLKSFQVRKKLYLYNAIWFEDFLENRNKSYSTIFQWPTSVLLGETALMSFMPQ